MAWFLGLYLAVVVQAYLKSAVPGNAMHLHQQFTLFLRVYFAFLIGMLAVLWRHNHGRYAQRYREWDRSFMCRRCGRISYPEA